MIKKNLPNILTSLRILPIPFFLNTMIYASMYEFFAILGFFVTTDILDGYVARKFKISSSFGRKFDGIADVICYGIIFITFCMNQREFFISRIYLLTLPIIIFITPKILGFLYHKRLFAFHLNSWRLTGFIILFWITASLIWQMNIIFYIPVLIGVIVSFIEETLIVITIRNKEDEKVHSYFELTKMYKD